MKMAALRREGDPQRLARQQLVPSANQLCPERLNLREILLCE
jgi:hypothetical protein